MKKKGFSLLLSLIIVSIFSSLSIFIIELSNLSNSLDTKNLLYTQAKFHLQNTENLLSQIDIFDTSKECIDTMSIENNLYDIKLYFYYITKRIDCNKIIGSSFDENSTKGMAIIDIFISPKKNSFNIKLHKKVIKKLE